MGISRFGNLGLIVANSHPVLGLEVAQEFGSAQSSQTDRRGHLEDSHGRSHEETLPRSLSISFFYSH